MPHLDTLGRKTNHPASLALKSSLCGPRSIQQLAEWQRKFQFTMDPYTETLFTLQMLLLHGEQYLELQGPVPTSATVAIKSSVVDIQRKGKATVVVMGISVSDAKAQQPIAYAEATIFLRGARPKEQANVQCVSLYNVMLHAQIYCFQAHCIKPLLHGKSAQSSRADRCILLILLHHTAF